MAARILSSRCFRPLSQSSFSSSTSCANSLSRYAAPSSCAKWQARQFTSSMPAWAKKYTENHEWVELDSDGKTGTVGISTYAAKALGDVVYVELPQVDVEINAGDTMGAVESVKSASDIYAPVSGLVTEANSQLEDAPGSVNKDPEGSGWIAKIQLTKEQELQKLMDSDAYDAFVGEQEH